MTDRREHAQALRESEERFRKLAEAAFEAALVHEAGTIVEANRGFTELFGYERDEVVGAPGVELLVAPESRPALAEALRTGREDPLRHHLPPQGRAPLRRLGPRDGGHVGGPPARVTALRDVTQERDAPEHLRRAYEQERDAAALVAVAQRSRSGAGHLRAGPRQVPGREEEVPAQDGARDPGRPRRSRTVDDDPV